MGVGDKRPGSKGKLKIDILPKMPEFWVPWSPKANHPQSESLEIAFLAQARIDFHPRLRKTSEDSILHNLASVVVNSKTRQTCILLHLKTDVPPVYSR